MAQTPARTYSDPEHIDYTPGAAVTGGAVVVLNGVVGIAVTDIAANIKGSLAVEGQFKLPKTTAAWVRGLPVHWDADGDPEEGDAGSGAANQLGVGTYAGICTETAASGTDYGVVQLNAQSNLLAVSAVTATGSTQANAAGLSQGINVVTGADATKGVKLPVAVPGMIVYVKGVTGAVLKVWPNTGAAINAIAADSAMSLANAAVPATFIATSATQWYTLPLVPS